MFKLDDERTLLFQWDLNRFLVINESLVKDGCTLVDFSLSRNGEALTCEMKEQEGMHIVEIPNILLQSHGILYVYADVVGANKRKTRLEFVFRIHQRSKPATYVYTETEVASYEALAKRVDEIEKNGISSEQIATAVEKYLDENPINTGVNFEVDEDTLSLENEVLSVKTTDIVAKDDKRPITSGAVYDEFSKAVALLGTI